jgi:hypothetical protein
MKSALALTGCLTAAFVRQELLEGETLGWSAGGAILGATCAPLLSSFQWASRRLTVGLLAICLPYLNSVYFSSPIQTNADHRTRSRVCLVWDRMPSRVVDLLKQPRKDFAMEGQFWSLAVVGGPVLLALAIAFALIRRRRLSSTEKQAQDAGTHRQYHDARD